MPVQPPFCLPTNTLFIFDGPTGVAFLQNSEAGIRQSSLPRNASSSLVKAVLSLTAVAFRVPTVLHSNNPFPELTRRGAGTHGTQQLWELRASQTWEVRDTREWARAAGQEDTLLHSQHTISATSDASWCVHVCIAYTVSVCTSSTSELCWYFTVFHLRYCDVLVP